MKLAVKTYKLYTLGCKVNQCDSRDIGLSLNKLGLEKAGAGADLAVINSCAVTKTAISKNKRIINKARKENPTSKIILTGCWTKTGDIRLESINGAEYLVVKKKEKIADNIKKLFAVEKNPEPKTERRRSRYFLKIQDGCDQYCSYCIIPYVRGRLKSKPSREVKKELAGAIRAGFEEIVLCGIHLGRYGKDLGSKVNLEGLLKNIIGTEGLGRIRLSSIEVNEVNNGLIRLMKDSDKICHYLHIPLQSGSDKVLKKMNRPYSAVYFEKRIDFFRKMVPDIAIGSDVITGFPGESMRDFQETCSLIKKLKFSRLHVFPYSRHENTAAAKMKGHLAKEEIITRAKKLRKIGKVLENNFFKENSEKKQTVLVERINGKEAICKSEYYFDIKVNISDLKPLKQEQAKISGFLSGKLACFDCNE